MRGTTGGSNLRENLNSAPQPRWCDGVGRARATGCVETGQPRAQGYALQPGWVSRRFDGRRLIYREPSGLQCDRWAGRSWISRRG